MLGTPDGSWLGKTIGFVTCQSGFLGSTGMSKLFPELLQTLGVLRQMTWPRPSRSLLCMSSTISRGVMRFRITSCGLILGGTWDGSLEYHILLWIPLQLNPLIVLSLLTRRFLLSNSGASESEWAVQWGILMCFIIQRRLSAWCRAYNLSGACWNRCRLRGGGVGVHGMDQYDLCSFFYDILLDLVVILLHLRFLAFFYDIIRYFIPLFFVI